MPEVTFKIDDNDKNHGNNNERESLLDRFPLSTRDLDLVLLHFYEYYYCDTINDTNIGATEATAAYFLKLLQQQQQQNCSDAAANDNNENENEQLATDLARILQHAIDTVFVISSYTPSTTTTTTTEGEDDDIDKQKQQKQGRDEQQRKKNQRDKYLEAVVSLLGRRTENFLIDALYEYAVSVTDNSVDNVTTDCASTQVLMNLSYRLASFAAGSSCSNDVPAESSSSESPATTTGHSNNNDDHHCWSQTLSQFQPTTKDTSTAAAIITHQEWKDWISKTGSPLHFALSTVFCRVWGIQDGLDKFPTQFMLPKCGDDNVKLPFTRSELLALSGMGLGNGGTSMLSASSSCWHPLYDTRVHGLSFRTFREALLSYNGPTLIYIRTTNTNESLGYMTGIPWKDSSKWHTFNKDRDEKPIICDSFLFRLSPYWNIYPLNPLFTPKSIHKFHQYLHTPYESKAKIKPPLRGLCVGGVDADSPRLHLTESLENCRAGCYDLVFGQGPLLSSADEMFFDVDLLQVWAVKTDEPSFVECLKTGRLHASIRETMRQRIAHVDKRQFVEDFQSGAYMNDLYNHREQTRGRTDFVAHDDERAGYWVEGKRPSVAQLRVNDDDDDDNDDDDDSNNAS